jgi:hypothetical protein
MILNVGLNKKMQSQLEYLRMSLLYGILKMTTNRGDRPSFMKEVVEK